MPRLMALCLLLVLPATAAASELVLAIESESGPVAVRIEQPADFMAVPLEVEVDIDDPLERIDPMISTIAAVRAALIGKSGLSQRSGSVTLSGGEGGKFLSSVTGSGRSRAALYLMADLSSDHDIFQRTREIYEIVAAIEPPRGVSISPGTSFLGVRDPESYRGQLLQRIGEHIAVIRATLGAEGRISLDGLENPVHVVAKDDSTVRLYIPYSLAVELD